MSTSEASQCAPQLQPRFLEIKPQEIMLPARPDAFSRAVRTSEVAGEPDISINLFTEDALYQHGQKCADAVGQIVEPQFDRLNVVAGLFAEKLRALGVDPKAVIEEAVAKQDGTTLDS